MRRPPQWYYLDADNLAKPRYVARLLSDHLDLNVSDRAYLFGVAHQLTPFDCLRKHPRVTFYTVAGYKQETDHLLVSCIVMDLCKAKYVGHEFLKERGTTPKESAEIGACSINCIH